MNLEAVLSQPKLIRAVTSLDADEFETLAQTFQRQWDAALARRTAEGQPRQRVPGAGAKGVLSTARHKLFFILLYCKLHPLQPVMQILFGLSQPQVSEWGGTAVARLGTSLGKKAGVARPQGQGLGRGFAALSRLGILPGRDGAAAAPSGGSGATEGP